LKLEKVAGGETSSPKSKEKKPAQSKRIKKFYMGSLLLTSINQERGGAAIFQSKRRGGRRWWASMFIHVKRIRSLRWKAIKKKPTLFLEGKGKISGWDVKSITYYHGDRKEKALLRGPPGEGTSR